MKMYFYFFYVMSARLQHDDRLWHFDLNFFFHSFIWPIFKHVNASQKIYKVHDRFVYKIIIFSIIAVIVAEVLCL